VGFLGKPYLRGLKRVCENSTLQESVSLAERNRNWTGGPTFANATKFHREIRGEAHDRFKLSVQLNPFGAAEPSS
jgi:hypothetical protein